MPAFMEYLEQVSKTGPGGRSENLDGQWSRRASTQKATNDAYAIELINNFLIGYSSR
jgi:hypothetical protein